MTLLRLLFCWALTAQALVAQDITWPADFWDPAAKDETYGGADLILPLPCGAAMAFQKVLVPVAAQNPLEDQRIRLGQSSSNTGFADYLFTAFLRGAFTDTKSGGSIYYIARYELTAGQARALRGDCAEPSPADRLAQGGLSWFDAVELGREMTEWLILQAPDTLPTDNDRRAFVRLPTEVEWEYATRGGARISPASYPGRLFFEQGSLEDYALFADGRRKTPGPVGIRNPNPLGLFDVYGNAEELMLEPFRMNVVGRPHGQAGGLVTRGGAIDAQAAQIYSAQRTEYPFYDAQTGSALAGSYFGARYVLSSNVVSDERFDAIRENWDRLTEVSTDTSGDALAQFAEILESEIDPRRKAALSGVQLQFRRAREEAQLAQQEMAKSTLLSAGAFIEAMKSGELELLRLRRLMNDLATEYQRRHGAERDAVKESMRQTAEKFGSEEVVLEAYILILRAALETLSTDVDEESLVAAYEGLASNLSAADQTAIQMQVVTAWELLEAYRSQPDMETDALVALVLAE